jgi:putative transposase
VSERRCCRALGLSRSSQRYQAVFREDEEALKGRIAVLAAAHRRYGYRRIGVLLAREGRCVNHKRVERLWREAGFQVPRRQHKRRRLNDGTGSVLRAEYPNHVWSYDFMEDRTHHGRKFRLLTVIDEFTRECLAIRVERRLNSRVVISELARLCGDRGCPQFLRSDNGPEFAARAVRAWLSDAGVSAAFVAPGSPWENGHCESFNGKFRDELLAGEVFVSLKEAQVVIEAWRRGYNTVRPHSSLDYRTPCEAMAEWLAGRGGDAADAGSDWRAAGTAFAPLRPCQQRVATGAGLS